jgi:putative transposase
MHVNLTCRMKVTGTNQLWVADITYVRLNREFVYLAIVQDKFSRRVVGWALGRTLTSRLPLAALRNALEDRKPGPGLVHHSDRGVQYLNASYVATLRKYSIIASISRPANPGDNANCESFFRTLKREEIRTREYADVEDLRTKMSRFIDSYYNRKRLHSALGYRSPAEFEKAAISAAAARISSVIELDSWPHESQTAPKWRSMSTVTKCRRVDCLNGGFTTLGPRRRGEIP